MPTIKKGKIITVTSMKGGVGKTTTVLQLAAMLSVVKKRVLIIDLDLYNGDIAFALNIDVKKNVYNLCDDVANNRYKGDYTVDYVTKYNDSIDVLPAPKDPRQASKVEFRYLEVLLRNFSSRYDVILIDTNHILSPVNMVAFENSNVILDIFTNSSFDIKNTRNFVSICKNMGVDNIFFVLNNALDERRDCLSCEEIESLIKEKITYIIPKTFRIKNFDPAVLNGRGLELLEKSLKKSSRDAIDFSKWILKLLDNNKVGDTNEKE